MIKKLKTLFKPFLYDIVHMGGKLKYTVCGRRSKYFQEAGIFPDKKPRAHFAAPSKDTGFFGITSRPKLISKGLLLKVLFMLLQKRSWRKKCDH